MTDTATVTKYVEAIDRHLQKEGVPIPLRSFRAIGELAKKLQQTIDGQSELAKFVESWFERRYGDRFRSATFLGRLPVLVRSDVLTIQLRPIVERRGDIVRPTYGWAFDTGEEVFDSLSGQEQAEIVDLLKMAFLCFSELAPYVCERVLSAAATADLETSCDRLTFADAPDPQLAIWASLQAVEKTLKEFIRSKGGNPPLTHDLHELNDLALRHDLPDTTQFELPEGKLLELLDVPSGVRYGEPQVSVDRAVAGHHAALLLCAFVAAKLRVEAGKENWLSQGTSPGSLIVRRMVEMAGMSPRPDAHSEDAF